MFTRRRTAAEAMLIEDSGASEEAPSATIDQPGSSQGSTEPVPNPCILLVEDDFLVGMEMEAGLEDAGYEVAGIAATAEEALAMAAEHRPALIVMDIRLAGPRDGVDAALEIYRNLGIRSLFASAHVDAGVRARAAAARPLGWVAKPYRIETLLKAIEEALREV